MRSTGTQVEEKKVNSQSENRRGGKGGKDKEGEVRQAQEDEEGEGRQAQEDEGEGRQSQEDREGEGR